MRVRARHPIRAGTPRPSHPFLRGLPLGQDAPHLDGCSHAVGTEARPTGRAPARHPSARRTAAKTFVSNALSVAGGGDADVAAQALAEAHAALDRAAKVGAIHPNAAARRKSRLTLKVNAAAGGAHVQSGGRVTKTTSKAQAAKAAKARIAVSKADKAKGAQTAAGKARAALSKTARTEAAAAAAAKAAAAAEAPAAKTATKAPARSGAKAP